MASMTQKDWLDLVGRFLPQVRLSNSKVGFPIPQEVIPFVNLPVAGLSWAYATCPGDYVDPYAPSTIDWFLQRTTLMSHSDPSLNVPSPTRADIAAKVGPDYFLKPAGNDQSDPAVYLGDRANAVMYAHIRQATAPVPADQDWIDIQYWFFYPYNGEVGGPCPNMPIGASGSHEGDWEHVTVRLSDWRTPGVGKIEAVFFAAHASREGKWLMKQSSSPQVGSYAVLDGTHPIVYSAWHTHGSYECEGVHYRWQALEDWPIAGLAVRDVCSGGYNWGYKNENSALPNPVELSWVDSAVYQPGDEQITNGDWLNFGAKKDKSKGTPAGGYWGELGGPPVTPLYQGTWANDGLSGYYFELESLAPLGADWKTDQWITCIDFGVLGRKEVVGIGITKGSGNRYEIHYYDPVTKTLPLMPNGAGGSTWGKDFSATGIAFGHYGDEGVVAVCRNADSNSRFEISTYESGVGLKLLSHGGDSWGNDRYATAIDLGTFVDVEDESLGSISLAAVSRKTKDKNDDRFYIYQVIESTSELQALCTGGSNWNDSDQYSLDIALGKLNGLQVVGVTRYASKGSRYEIYEIKRSGGKFSLKFLCSGGEGWGEDREAMSIAFGVLGGRQVVGVARSKGDNSRFEICYLTKTDTGYALELLVSGGTEWDTDLGASGIAFGFINNEGVVGVSRMSNDNDPANILTYRYEEVDGTKKLVPYGSKGEDWGANRIATCIAFGSMGANLNVVGYGRASETNQRGEVLQWA